MSSVNCCVLVGNVGSDAEVKTDRFSNRYATFSMALSRRTKNPQTGDTVDKTAWARIRVRNKHLVDVCEKWVKKGKKVYVRAEFASFASGSGANVKYFNEFHVNAFGGELQVLTPSGNKAYGADTAADDYYGEARPTSSSGAA